MLTYIPWAEVDGCGVCSGAAAGFSDLSSFSVSSFVPCDAGKRREGGRERGKEWGRNREGGREKGKKVGGKKERRMAREVER